MINKQAAVVVLGGMALVACGRVDAVPDLRNSVVVTPAPYTAPGVPGQPAGQPSQPEPTPSPSPTPKPPPEPPATGSIFLGTIGDGDLADPRGLAFAGGSLFVADAGRHGLLGPHGAVLRFDPEQNKRQALYTARTSSTSLPVDLMGVAVSTRSASASVALAFVYPIAPWALFGFVADKGYPLNFGAPYVPGGADVAVAGGRAWVAHGDLVRPFTLPWWRPDTATSAVEIAGATGIGVDAAGAPWIAAGGRVFHGQTPFEPVADGPFEASDVAVDPRDGAIVVLDRARLRRYDRDGASQGTAGEGRIQDGRSVAIGDDGCVYVSDRAARRVYRFAPP